MVKLRGHHIICMQFFKGEGFGKIFMENLIKVLEAAESEGVDLVDGVDDICILCPYYQDNECRHDNDMGEKSKRMDELAINFLNFKEKKVGWKEIRRATPNIITEWIKKECNKCDELNVCEMKSKLLYYKQNPKI
ncbi:hypothetical protein METP3_01748 [Methanosarcinales archaeon]|nr:hypothetical protein METP3_01748 [Methanosarcinales archaeon]